MKNLLISCASVSVVLLLAACATPPTTTPATAQASPSTSADPTANVINQINSIVTQACSTYLATAPTAEAIAAITAPKASTSIAAAASYANAFCSAPPPTATASTASATESAVWLGQQALLVAQAVQAAKAAPAK